MRWSVLGSVAFVTAFSTFAYADGLPNAMGRRPMLHPPTGPVSISARRAARDRGRRRTRRRRRGRLPRGLCLPVVPLLGGGAFQSSYTINGLHGGGTAGFNFQTGPVSGHRRRHQRREPRRTRRLYGLGWPNYHTDHRLPHQHDLGRHVDRSSWRHVGQCSHLHQRRRCLGALRPRYGHCQSARSHLLI